MDYDWPEFPVILGQGSLHNLSDDAGKVFGEQGARIRVRLKPRPIGFKFPVKPRKPA